MNLTSINLKQRRKPKQSSRQEQRCKALDDPFISLLGAVKAHAQSGLNLDLTLSDKVEVFINVKSCDSPIHFYSMNIR